MKEAPLAVASQALYLAVTREVLGWGQAPAVLLGQRTIDYAAEVAESCRLALAFPSDRLAFVARADEALARLRPSLVVAEEVGLLSAARHVELTETMDEIGKMIGGWRRSLAP